MDMGRAELDMRLLQVSISRQFQRRFNISDDKFIELNNKYSILQYLEDNYYIFHLQGDEGTLTDLVNYLRKRGLNI